jgi:hypothetical protein
MRYLKVAVATVIIIIVVLWFRNSQETNRQSAIRANVVRDWTQCSTQVKTRLVASDERSSVDDLLKSMLLECQTQYRAYVEKVWEWREDALTEVLKKKSTEQKKFALLGDRIRPGKLS